MKIFYTLLLGLLMGQCTDKPPVAVNKDASPEAQELLEFLIKISGEKRLSGQHNYIHSPFIYTEKAKEITGRSPAIWGCDFSYATDSARGSMIRAAQEMHSRGAIITLMWHSCFPEDGMRCSPAKIWHRQISDSLWNELVTPGTELHEKWLRQLDYVAEFLKVLRDEHIPVLWRPYHEMNGIWFWWGNKPGPNGYQALWKGMYDRFVNHHQLNNLVWVWNANAPRDTPGDEAYPYADFYPGNSYVDILAADVYHRDYRKSHHDQLLVLGGGKPIALGEVGGLPTPEQLAEQPEWCWFMVWSDWLIKENTAEEVQAVYNMPGTLSLDSLHDVY